MKYYVESGGNQMVFDAKSPEEAVNKFVLFIDKKCEKQEDDDEEDSNIQDSDDICLGSLICVNESGFQSKLKNKNSLFFSTEDILSELGLIDKYIDN